jgi:hypothetical protein
MGMMAFLFSPIYVLQDQPNCLISKKGCHAVDSSHARQIAVITRPAQLLKILPLLLRGTQKSSVHAGTTLFFEPQIQCTIMKEMCIFSKVEGCVDGMMHHAKNDMLL